MKEREMSTCISVDFLIKVDCDDTEPSLVVPFIEGTIFEESEEEPRTEAGRIYARLVQAGRAMNEGIALYDAMDSIDGECEECFCALFKAGTDDWNPAIEELYGEAPCESDVLFIQRMELEPKYRGRGIGARAVEATIGTFGSSCSLVVCKPLPLQYCGGESAGETEAKQLTDFEKVRRFWIGCGFRRIPSSDFFTHALWLKTQPAISPAKHARKSTKLRKS